MVRITKVHTGGGDGGETSLVDGSRVAKSDARIEIVGTCDEVNALLGLVLMETNRLPDTHSDGGTRITVRRVKDVCSAALGRMQSELFDLGAELACPPTRFQNTCSWLTKKIRTDYVKRWMLGMKNWNRLRVSFFQPVQDRLQQCI